MSDDPVKMARLAQRDERMSTGALYGDLADRIEDLEAKLAKVVAVLHNIVDHRGYADDPWGIVQSTLAELTGGKDE